MHRAAGVGVAVLFTLISVLALWPGTAVAREIGASEATRVASRDPNVARERDENGALTHSAPVLDLGFDLR